MNNLRKYAVFFAFSLLFAGAYAQKLAEPILLWPDGAPRATGSSDEDKPAITPFIPEASKRNGATILVIPGGGFTIRAVDHEGVLVAQWLEERGITAFLLRYRLRPLYERADWLRDGQRAMQYIRAHADEYHIAKNRVGAVGFSAGANLVADLAFNNLAAITNASDALDRYDSRPDFGILAYGAMQMPANYPNPELIPPIFIYGTDEDRGSIEGMSSLFSSLVKARVPVEAHFFRNGDHGTGFAMGDPILGEWPGLMHNWMKAGGFLSDQHRNPIDGIVKLDGAPLLRGMIIFTPIGMPNVSPVTVYITNTGTGPLGRFAIPKHQGLVDGTYHVEVRQDATRWTSNSRDPFMIKMTTKQRDSTLTGADIKEWGDYLRKRNLSPSIEHQKIFKKQHPSDKNGLSVRVKSGEELSIEVFSK
jgi:acetyl esterase/lipase